MVLFRTDLEKNSEEKSLSNLLNEKLQNSLNNIINGKYSALKNFS